MPDSFWMLRIRAKAVVVLPTGEYGSLSVTLSFSTVKAGLVFKSRAGVGRGLEESQVLTQEDDGLGGDEQRDRDVGLAIRHGQEERLKVLRLVPPPKRFVHHEQDQLFRSLCR